MDNFQATILETYNRYQHCPPLLESQLDSKVLTCTTLKNLSVGFQSPYDLKELTRWESWCPLDIQHPASRGFSISS